MEKNRRERSSVDATADGERSGWCGGDSERESARLEGMEGGGRCGGDLYCLDGEADGKRRGDCPGRRGRRKCTGEAMALIRSLKSPRGVRSKFGSSGKTLAAGQSL